MSTGTRRSCLVKKNRSKKMSWACPFKLPSLSCAQAACLATFPDNSLRCSAHSSPPSSPPTMELPPPLGQSWPYRLIPISLELSAFSRHRAAWGLSRPHRYVCILKQFPYGKVNCTPCAPFTVLVLSWKEHLPWLGCFQKLNAHIAWNVWISTCDAIFFCGVCTSVYCN